jgi:hypothetical protein
MKEIKETTAQYEKTALEAYKQVSALILKMTALSLPNEYAQGFDLTVSNPLAQLFSYLMQENLIEIGLADGDFTINERLFVEHFALQSGTSILELFSNVRKGRAFTWDEFFTLNGSQMTQITDLVKIGLNPIAQAFFGTFALADSHSETKDYYHGFIEGLTTIVNSYLSIDLARTGIENQRALDVISDNILKPLDEAYQNVVEVAKESDMVDRRA